MTIPTMMNCPHDDTGWCIECVMKLQTENERLKVAGTDMTRNCCEVRKERDSLLSTCERARSCINGLLNRTPVRDVDETLAEIDAAIARKP
jgi:hypothetical protein